MRPLPFASILLMALILAGAILGCSSGPIGVGGVYVAPEGGSRSGGSARRGGGGCGSGMEGRSGDGREQAAVGLSLNLQGSPQQPAAPPAAAPPSQAPADDAWQAQVNAIVEAVHRLAPPWKDSHQAAEEAHQVAPAAKSALDLTLPEKEHAPASGGAPEAHPDTELVSKTATAPNGSTITMAAGYRGGFEYVSMVIVSPNGVTLVNMEMYHDPTSWTELKGKRNRDHGKIKYYDKDGHLIGAITISEEGWIGGEVFNEDGVRTGSWTEWPEH